MELWSWFTGGREFSKNVITNGGHTTAMLRPAMTPTAIISPSHFVSVTPNFHSNVPSSTFMYPKFDPIYLMESYTLL